MAKVMAKRAASSGVRMADIVMFFLVMGFVGALHSSRIVWTSSPVRK
jgi:hypothetical protein